MPATRSDLPDRVERKSAVVRFEANSTRTPTSEELASFRLTEEALVLELPRRIRRRAARAICRL